jgi:plasmid stabilization system protein ParE
MVNGRRVVWDDFARAALKIAFNHIKEDSPQQAEKVKRDILAATHALLAHPEIYPADKYRQDKDSSFRAFEIHNYRISYLITEDTIRILRLRHVKQEPKDY